MKWHNQKMWRKTCGQRNIWNYFSDIWVCSKKWSCLRKLILQHSAKSQMPEHLGSLVGNSVYLLWITFQRLGFVMLHITVLKGSKTAQISSYFRNNANNQICFEFYTTERFLLITPFYSVWVFCHFTVSFWGHSAIGEVSMTWPMFEERN